MKKGEEKLPLRDDYIIFNSIEVLKKHLKTQFQAFHLPNPVTNLRIKTLRLSPSLNYCLIHFRQRDCFVFTLEVFFPVQNIHEYYPWKKVFGYYHPHLKFT